MSLHPLARRILSTLRDLAADGDLERGAPLRDVYGIEPACDAPLDQAIADWLAAGAPTDVARDREPALRVLTTIRAEPGCDCQRVADELGLSTRAVRVQLARLVRWRLVRVERRDRGYHGLTLTPSGFAALTLRSTT